MTPEEQIETYRAIEDSAAVMVVAELRLIRQAAQVATVLFLLFLLMIFGAVIANAAPIEALPLPTQRWYTADIPTPEGVFAFEVYAPALPRIVAADLVPIYVLGDPPRLVDVPEPGTGWMMVLATGIGFVLWVNWMVNKWRSCLRSDREAMERAGFVGFALLSIPRGHHPEAFAMSHEAIDLTTLLFTVPIAWVLVMAFVWMVVKEPKR